MTSGSPPYSYSWSGVLSGNSGTIFGNVSSSGTLYLTVTDSQSNQANAQKFINSNWFNPSCLL